MRIRIKGILATNHSWAIVHRALANEFSKENSIFLESINGTDMVPDKMINRMIPCFNADLDISYTMPENFLNRFFSKSKIKAAIYNYESSILPVTWSDKHRHLDFVFPSSNYCKEIFLKAGYPEDKVFVIPHGVDHILDQSPEDLSSDIDKNFFNFISVGIPHYRKNLSLLIEAYYSSFTIDDNTCLNIKTKIKNPKRIFEVNILDEVQRIQRKFDKKKLPKIKFLTKQYRSMNSLYKYSDVFVTATSSEGFGLPILEAMHNKLAVISPHQTGQKDFLTKNNSYEIGGRFISAPENYQYWRPSKGSEIFMPDIDSISECMVRAYNEDRSKKISEAYEDSKKYTWENAVSKIFKVIS